MANQNTVWVVISTDSVIDRIRSLIDSGFFGEAQSLHNRLVSVAEDLNRMLQQRGGSVRLSTYDRTVLEMSISVAEDLPQILLAYKDFFSDRMSVGIGFDLSEASKAAEKSSVTGDIELYDPNDSEEINKSDRFLELPPNLFDRTDPDSPEPEFKPPKAPSFKPVTTDAETFMQAQAAMIQSIIQTISPPAPQQPPQSQQQEAGSKPEKNKPQPRDLLEMLHGQQIDGHAPSDKEEQAQEPKEEPKEKIEDKDHEKFVNLLAIIQDKMPKLMELSDKNPEAFKKILGLFHKVINVAKTKNIQKDEVLILTEELNKAFKHRWPVGTVKGRKKKVIINGKAVWRQMASGQVLDDKGEPISVKSSNFRATKKD